MRLANQSQFIPLQNVVHFITLPVLVRKIFTFYINDVLLFKCPVPGSKGSKLNMVTDGEESFIMRSVSFSIYRELLGDAQETAFLEG